MQQPINNEIKDEFRKYGCDFFLVSLSGDYRIYRREKRLVETNEVDISYEIIKPISLNGVLRYPSSSLWGVYGWTCTSEKHVVEKMEELMNKQEQTPK